MKIKICPDLNRNVNPDPGRDALPVWKDPSASTFAPELPLLSLLPRGCGDEVSRAKQPSSTRQDEGQTGTRFRHLRLRRRVSRARAHWYFQQMRRTVDAAHDWKRLPLPSLNHLSAEALAKADQPQCDFWNARMNPTNPSATQVAK